MFAEAKRIANSSPDSGECSSKALPKHNTLSGPLARPSDQSSAYNTDYVDYESLTMDPVEELKQFLTIGDDSDDDDKTGGGKCSTMQQDRRYNWTYDETLLLIKSYASHEDERSHPKLRQHMWDNIVNDMISHGYNSTKELCTAKWSNLQRSYKHAKDLSRNQTKTGRAPTKFLFFDVMDEFLGNKPSNSSPHTMGSLKKKIPQSDTNNNSEESGDKNMDDAVKAKKQRVSRKKKSSHFVDQAKENRDLKMQRHNERMALEEARLEVERQKIKLMKVYLQEKSQNKCNIDNSDE